MNKLITKEQIISLGWEWIDDRGMQENLGDLFRYEEKPVRDHYELRIWYIKHNFHRGYRVNITSSNTDKFNVYLKNISELKLLMEQLDMYTNE